MNWRPKMIKGIGSKMLKIILTTTSRRRWMIITNMGIVKLAKVGHDSETTK